MRATVPARFVKATVFRAASQERLRDAQCLHESGRFHGAIYLCGYAVECYLKFCYCMARRVSTIDEREAKRLGHGLVEMLDACGLSRRLAESKDLRDLYIAFHRINDRWSTNIRYSGATGNSKESESFLGDAEWLLLWLSTASKS
jgi:hypothetical protein